MEKGRIEITVNGEAYPCYQTGGAMLRFKDLTGKEVSEINPQGVSDLIRFLWCCTVSACAREKRTFPLSLMEFADHIDNTHLLQWQRSMEEAAKEEQTSEGQKKSPVA